MTIDSNKREKNWNESKFKIHPKQIEKFFSNLFWERKREFIQNKEIKFMGEFFENDQNNFEQNRMICFLKFDRKERIQILSRLWEKKRSSKCQTN